MWLVVVLDHDFKAYPNVGCIVHYDNKCIQLYWNSIVIGSSLTKEQLHSTIESVVSIVYAFASSESKGHETLREFVHLSKMKMQNIIFLSHSLNG